MTEADAFVACTSGDNTNITAAEIVREVFSVPRVIARINDPIREAIFQELGLETVCPTTMGAEIVREILLAGPLADGEYATSNRIGS